MHTYNLKHIKHICMYSLNTCTCMHTYTSVINYTGKKNPINDLKRYL